MFISVINHTNGLLGDAEVQRAVRAVNRQLHEDFAPQWSIDATLGLEGQAGGERQRVAEVRGDAVIYLWHPVNVRGALGYHLSNFLGIPYGVVFPDISISMGEPWTTTLSHEALELAADPQVNLLVMGPHPAEPRRTVFHWQEVCDAVQAEAYEIDGVPVSNFVLPLYFTNSEETGSRNDFLHRTHYGRTLRSFGINPGGYVGFYNPATNQNDTFFAEGDAVALRRLQIKQQLALTRRSKRYQYRATASEPVTAAIRAFLERT